MAQEIVLSPDERLRTECAAVEAIDDEIKKTAKKMAKLMYKYDGCGIAAPQIGVLKQIVVIDCNWGDTGEKDPIYLINPYIVEQSEEKARQRERNRQIQEAKKKGGQKKPSTTEAGRVGDRPYARGRAYREHDDE